MNQDSTTSDNIRHQNLRRLLNPKHIAYIGGSQIAGSLATSVKSGFKGELWVVNPVREKIDGFKCYASIEELPQAPDAALIALSAEKTVQAVKSLACIGSGGAVCMAAGFAEIGTHGAKLQQQLIHASGDMAILGPNCMGMLNQFEGAAVWGSANHIEHPSDHAAAIISQSGAFLFGITNIEQGFPLGYAISTGNQAVTDIADCINAVLADNRIRAIGIYLEGLDDGNALANACKKAVENGIPIVAMKGGDTADAESVAISHTSAMVVERDLWLAFCYRYGIAQVSTPKSMVEALKLLTIGGMPAGNRLMAVTYSGGLNSLIVAKAPELGLRLNHPKTKNSALLRNQLPKTINIENPFDLNLPWRSKTGMSLEDGDAIAESLCTFASGSADMAVMFLDVPRPDEHGSDRDWYPSMEAMAQIKNKLSIPCAVAGILPEGLSPDLRRHLINVGIAPLLGFSDAMEAISVAAKVAAVHKDKSNRPIPGALLDTNYVKNNTTNRRMLDEAQSKYALTQYGLRTPANCSARKNQLEQAATKIGYPVALKLVSNSISHKAKIGGVKLNLNSKEQLQQAAVDICESVKHHHGTDVDKFLIESMVTEPIAEYIIGIKRQSALGLAMMIGHGGVSAEYINKFSTVLLPLVDIDLKNALQTIGLTPDLPGYRSIFKAAHSIANYAIDHVNQLESLDVNPVMVTKAGDAIATDALIVLTEGES